MNKLIRVFCIKALMILFLISSFSYVKAQSSANYSFTTNSTSSLNDMTGAAQLLGPGLDDVASASQTIPFYFYMYGFPINEFNVNSNGFLSLGFGGPANMSGSQNVLGTAGKILITALGSDEETQLSTGGVFYKVTGVSPNQVLTVEFRDMTLIYDGGALTADATTQIRLYETTGAIEFVYGTVKRNNSTGSGAMNPMWVGFSFGSADNLFATVKTSTGIKNTIGGPVSQQYALGLPVGELTSASQGNRKMYKFTPPVPLPPTNLSFTAVSATGMTLNWDDNAINEVDFVVYRSDDNGNSYKLVSIPSANSISLVQNDLLPNKLYFFKIYAVTEGGVSPVLQGSHSTTGGGNITSNGTGGGLWGDFTTWTGGVLPTSNDNVTILDGDNVTINQPSEALSLQVGNGVSGNLIYKPDVNTSLTVKFNVVISPGGSFRSAASGTVTDHELEVGGDLINNGTLNFSTNNNNCGANITFYSNQNYTYNYFGGTGAITNVRTIRINKTIPNDTSVVELKPSNFTVRSVNSDAAGFLNIITGVFKISGSFLMTNRVFTTPSFNIPNRSGIWLNNPNFTIAAQSSSDSCSGLFRVTQGIFNIGVLSDNSIAFDQDARIIIEGGFINIAGRFCAKTAAQNMFYKMTGGVLTVCTAGNTSSSLASFDLGTFLTSDIKISGGVIVCQLANTSGSGPRDYRDQAGNGITGVTGGALQLGNSFSGSAKNYTIGGVLPNLTINNSSAGHTAALNTTIVNYNNISLNITINPGNTLNCSNLPFLFYGNNILNNGTLTHNGANSQFWIYKPSTNVAFSGTGITNPLTNLILQNDLNFTISSTLVNNVIANSIVLLSGSVVNAGKLTLGSGGVSTGIIQIGSPVTPSAGGSFDQPLTFNLGIGGENISYLRTTTAKTLGGELNTSKVLTNLTIDPDAGNTVINHSGDIQVTNTLSLTSGTFNLGGGTLTLGNSSPFAGVLNGTISNLINGKFKRWITAVAGNYDFPIGTQINSANIVSTNSKDKKNIKEGVKAGFNENYIYSEKMDLRVDGSGSFKNVKTVSQTSPMKSSGINSPEAVSDVSRIISVNFTFPPSSAGTLTAEWIALPGGGNGLPLSQGAININKCSDDGYWKITSADGLSGGTYNITATGTGINGINDFTKLVLLKRTGNAAPWILDGVHVAATGNNAAPVLKRTGIVTGFSEFGIGGDFTVNPLPVELASFTSIIDKRNVELKWSTNIEQNNSGFEIERAENDTSYKKIGFVTGAGNSNTTQNYKFVDRNLPSGKYNYRLRQMDNNGNFRYYELSNEVIIGIPSKFYLSQNYPNPFNPTTKINYDLPIDSKVEIKLYDMTGRVVAEILNIDQQAGYYTVNFNAAALSSGIYFYNISALGGTKNFNLTKKMALIK
ncbi:hypothetical protein BH10BAC5_BH10BAC5_23390 [soil metagenome]